MGVTPRHPCVRRHVSGSRSGRESRLPDPDPLLVFAHQKLDESVEEEDDSDAGKDRSDLAVVGREQVAGEERRAKTGVEHRRLKMDGPARVHSCLKDSPGHNANHRKREVRETPCDDRGRCRPRETAGEPAGLSQWRGCARRLGKQQDRAGAQKHSDDPRDKRHGKGAGATRRQARSASAGAGGADREKKE